MDAVNSPLRLWRTVVLCSLALAFISWQVATGGPLSRFDQSAAITARNLHKNRDFFEITVMAGLRGIILTVCIPLLAWRSWVTRTWLPIAGFAGVLVLETGLVGALKVAVGRSFPYQGEMLLEVGHLAFPSGHAANAVALWGWVAWLWAREERARATRLWSYVVAGAVMVAYSSWIIRTHWPTDLAAGFLLGAMSLAAVVALVEATELSRTATPVHARATRP